MTEMPRETVVLDAVVTLVDSMLDDFDVVELLTDLTAHCAGLLDVTAAGLLLADPWRHLHLMAATSVTSEGLDLFHLQSDEGPCLDCYTSSTPVAVSELGGEVQRWPRFAPAAIEAGVASVYAVPMRAAGTVLGTLGLFGARSGELDAADQLVARTLAHIACVAILQEYGPTPTGVFHRLRAAMVSRTLVEQAKGYLRGSLGVSTEHAFALLRGYANTHGEHLTDVCRRLIDEPDARQAILDGMRAAEDWQG